MTFLQKTEDKICWRMAQDENLNYESEDDDVLSLCDLPLGGDYEDLSTSKQDYKHRSPDHELFEFFNDLNHEMLAAEDIVFCGKLLPHKPPPLRLNYQHQHLVKSELRGNDQCSDFNRKGAFHCKSESMGEYQSPQSNVKGRLYRSSGSLDYRKLQRASTFSSIGSDVIPVGKRFTKSDSVKRVVVSPNPTKPRWHLFMFGFIRPQMEMELSDMRNRQTRRSSSGSSSSKYPMLNDEETVSAKRKTGNGSWRLLRALGCSGHADKMVTTSLSCVPQV